MTIQRFGVHMMPTTIRLTFDQALDAVTAEDSKDYRIIGPSGHGSNPHGLMNTAGKMFDGASAGSVAGDYRGLLAWRNLVLTPAVKAEEHVKRS